MAVVGEGGDEGKFAQTDRDERFEGGGDKSEKRLFFPFRFVFLLLFPVCLLVFG